MNGERSHCDELNGDHSEGNRFPRSGQGCGPLFDSGNRFSHAGSHVTACFSVPNADLLSACFSQLTSAGGAGSADLPGVFP